MIRINLEKLALRPKRVIVLKQIFWPVLKATFALKFQGDTVNQS